MLATSVGRAIGASIPRTRVDRRGDELSASLQQIMGPWPKQGVFFSKLQYAPDPYTENPKQGAKKMGFGTGKPLSRDDLSSVLQVRVGNPIRGRGCGPWPGLHSRLGAAALLAPHPLQVGRFRSALQNEAKGAKAWEQTIMTEATRLGATRSAMATQRPTAGLAAAQPRFTSAFDRQRHVEEFRINKRPPSEKYDRNYGPMRSTSRDIGEGCFESTHSPDFGIKIGVAAFTSKVSDRTHGHDDIMLEQCWSSHIRHVISALSFTSHHFSRIFPRVHAAGWRQDDDGDGPDDVRRVMSHVLICSADHSGSAPHTAQPPVSFSQQHRASA